MAKTEPKAMLLPTTEGPTKGPVECLGLTFESEDARRAHFLTRLKEHLPKLRERNDFPIGEDEDILRLSDPPYYTACPNPFLAEFVAHYGKPYDPDEPYHREPFAVDVSVGKTDPLYKAHGYHTKVPHKAIVPSILHYTEPGDIVLDGFCGSGMTGVAAQWCGTAPPEYRLELEQQWAKEGRSPPKWGARRAILGDLSPAATFIAANYNIPFDVDAFAQAAQKLLDDVEDEVGWMYETLHTDGKTKGRINYTVWSEVFTCPDCTGEVVFHSEAANHETLRVERTIQCPHCHARHAKEHMDLQFTREYDTTLRRHRRRPKRVPVLINYTVGRTKCEKQPDGHDLTILRRVAQLGLPTELPVSPLPDCQMTRVGRMRTTNTASIPDFFLPRPANALAALWRSALACSDAATQSSLLFLIEQAIWGLSTLNRYQPIQHGRPGGSQVNRQLSGVFYVSSQISECSPWYNLGGRVKRIPKAFSLAPSIPNGTTVSTESCSTLGAPDASVDYILTDPPFGENIYYSDLNYLVESWHGVLGQTELESIIDRVREKDIRSYGSSMERCFSEYRRVLKPGRWMTVVFHNSKNAIWNAIQGAILGAGFVVADVRVLDKKQGSFKQVTSNAVKRDLVISAYKPNGGLEVRFGVNAGTEHGVWDFVSSHLKRLPVVVTKGDFLEPVAERQDYLLFDRMVAFHVLRGATVPLAATEFYQGLRQRFAERDRMYFLPEQVVEYDRRRATAGEVTQLELFVKDEETAIQWLRRQLDAKPQTYQEIHPNYVKELAGWAKHEKMLELSALLRENFLYYDGHGEVPPQLRAYLSANHKALRRLPKDAAALRTKANARWYVPDPHKAADLEKLRDRALIREFKEYQSSGQRRLRLFRLEAVRAGFRQAWQAQDYATIVAVATRLPADVLQEDPKLLMWYDQAIVRQSGTGKPEQGMAGQRGER